MMENECLSSCTWQANPFFKTRPEGFDVHYGTKWYERFFTGDNTFPQLHDSPMVPKDLSCLSSCFVRYKSAPSEILTTIQRECSDNGIDRQIPTHLEMGTMMVENNFTTFFPSIPQPFNPNLDCLVYYETKERRTCSTNGVCNFIPVQQHPESQQSGQTNLVRGVNALSFKTTEDLLLKNYATIHPRSSYTKKILRGSSPVTKAIKVCAIAKLIQWHLKISELYSTVGQDKFLDAASLFSVGNPTCDHFMPDIFGSLCTCVGMCGTTEYDPDDSESNPPEDLLFSFETRDGIWACQQACRNLERCEFYTHSAISQTSKNPSFYCFLWEKCTTFTFKASSVLPQAEVEFEGFKRNPVISKHWSGPRDCSKYNQKCPVCDQGKGFAVSFHYIHMNFIFYVNLRNNKQRLP